MTCVKERGWCDQIAACRQTPNGVETLLLSQPIASSAAVDKHVAQHTHGDFAGPLEVVATLIAQGGGFAARASESTTTLHRIAAALKACNVATL